MIPVYKPWLTSLEKKYINDAVDTSWISSTGKYVDKAEELFAAFVGTKYAIVASSGTTALHLCYRALPNDDDGLVLIPNTTFIATAFTASYDNRKIRFVDVDPVTWNIDVDEVERICKQEQVSIVVPVHLYGNPADMARLLNLQAQYEFKIIEDACESLGAKIGNKVTGSMSDVACFSFYGNKTFTCGEGGAITTNDEAIATKAKLLRGQAQDPNKRYWHVDIGYNYRLTNTHAAILCGQLERAQEILTEKHRVSERYLEHLSNVEEIQFQRVLPGHIHSHWLVTFTLPPGKDNQDFSSYMMNHGVDTRKIFYPVTDMPPYVTHKTKYSVASYLSRQGVSLPSYPQLTNSEIDKICDLIKSYFT